MQQRLPLWLMLLVLGFCVSLRAQTPVVTGPVISAQIIATKVSGKVSMKLADQTQDVKNNMTVPTHAVVATGDNASVVLVFSNGATTQLGKNSELSIDEFLQDPFSAAINPADPSRDSEPSISQTKLRLTHGELVGDVKHLNHAQGSTFVVETPVGAAGIRGTVFRIVFIPDPVNPGRYTFSLSVPQGAVNLTQSTTGAVTTQTTTTTTGTSSSSTTAGGTTTQTDTTTTNGITTQTGTTPTQSVSNSSAGLTGVNVAQGNEIVVLVDIKTTTTPTGQTVITAATTSAPITANNTTPINAVTTATLMQTATTITTVATTVTNNFQTTTATGAITTSVTGNPNASAPSNPPSTTTTTTTTTTSNQNQSNPNQNQNNPNQTPTPEKTTTSTITQTQAPTQTSPGSTTTITLTPGAGGGTGKPPGG